tara:strand:+ start:138 stop:395 length:258 start_codon:yes stop_codon:yes gene_type:complete
MVVIILVKRELATIDQSVDWAVNPIESFHPPLLFFLVVLKGNAPLFGRVAGAIIYTSHIISLLQYLTTLKGFAARIISLSTLYHE